MPTQTTTIQCRNCGQPVQATVYSLIDVMQEPQGKAELLSGRLNTAPCPNCGTVNNVVTPLLYHDATKELLVAMVPMELNLEKDAQERAIGDLMNQLPKDNFKAYMFQPKRALTMQGLVEQVLEADGITPEMMEEQKERVRRVQEIIDASEAELPALIEKYDDDIDVQFIQTFTLIAQRMLEGGQAQQAEQAIKAQNRVVELSKAGQELLEQQKQQEQVIEEVTQEIQALGEGASRQQFFDLANKYADDEMRLQALVGLVRPAFDYEFFQEMTTRIGQAPAAERERIETMRDKILQWTTAIDQQSQQAMQNAAGFLQAVVNSPDPKAMIEANIDMIDDTLLSVLSANVQEAEKRGDPNTGARLKEIYNIIMTVLQSNMQPELVFVNQLLSAPDEAAANELLKQQGPAFGPELLEVMKAVEEAFEEQGNASMKARVNQLRQQAEFILQ